MMLLDELLPEFDATRIEHRVLDGALGPVYGAVLEADFLRAAHDSPGVHTLFAARTAAERFAAAVRGTGYTAPVEPARLRLVDLPEEGEWIRLAADPPHEVVFGAIGRFWGGSTAWARIDPERFAVFEHTGFARIGCNFSLRPYGDRRVLVSYEARTQATDAASRSAFLRYWRAVGPGVGVVMRAELAVIAHTLAEQVGATAAPAR